MTSTRTEEHFITLFDSKFLPAGLCLHSSLCQHAQPFRLWIVCQDETVETQLRTLNLPYTTLIPLCKAETDSLREVKNSRTKVEYFWTMTPFVPGLVFDRDESVARITYIDADLFFFDAPEVLLNEFERSKKHVMITEHSYAPEYDRSKEFGRFCVQFVTFRRTPEAFRVLDWWQRRCLEWCYDKHEDGKFGDQMYLDRWPELFQREVHILTQANRTLAPWNIHYYEEIDGNLPPPVFYHFHGLRLVAENRILLSGGYRIGPLGKKLYGMYVKTFGKVLTRMRESGFPVPVFRPETGSLATIRDIKRRVFDHFRYVNIS